MAATADRPRIGIRNTADRGSIWTKKEPIGKFHLNRDDSVRPFESILKAGITATILPKTALAAPKEDAKPGLRPARSEAKPPTRRMIKPPKKSVISDLSCARGLARQTDGGLGLILLQTGFDPGYFGENLFTAALLFNDVSEAPVAQSISQS